MKVTDLPKHWESKKESVERSHDYNLRLPLEDAARHFVFRSPRPIFCVPFRAPGF